MAILIFGYGLGGAEISQATTLAAPDLIFGAQTSNLGAIAHQYGHLTTPLPTVWEDLGQADHQQTLSHIALNSGILAEEAPLSPDQPQQEADDDWEIIHEVSYFGSVATGYLTFIGNHWRNALNRLKNNLDVHFVLNQQLAKQRDSFATAVSTQVASFNPDLKDMPTGWRFFIQSDHLPVGTPIVVSGVGSPSRPLGDHALLQTDVQNEEATQGTLFKLGGVAAQNWTHPTKLKRGDETASRYHRQVIYFLAPLEAHTARVGPFQLRDPHTAARRGR